MRNKYELESLENYTKPEGPVVLVILDGVGINPEANSPGNAVELAKPKNFEKWINLAKKNRLYTELLAHGPAVGLPTDKDMGNSEVGHNALGSGQIYDQGAKLVNKSIHEGQMYSTELWEKHVRSLAKSEKNGHPGATLHFIGLLSDGNVHSHIDQLYAILDQVKKEGIKRVRIHPLLDGRDVDPLSGIDFIKDLEKKLAELTQDSSDYDYRIASGGGRMYVTMDRYESDWQIVKRGFYAHVYGEILNEIYEKGCFIGYPGYFFDSVTAIKTARKMGNRVMKAQKKREILLDLFENYPKPKKELSAEKRQELERAIGAYFEKVGEFNWTLHQKIFSPLKDAYQKNPESLKEFRVTEDLIADIVNEPHLQSLKDDIESKKHAVCQLKNLTSEVLEAELQARWEKIKDDNYAIEDQNTPPWVVVDENYEPVGKMTNGDSVIFFNYRGDRAIQISMAFENTPEFGQAFDRGSPPAVNYAGMMLYDGDLILPSNYLVSPPNIQNVSGQYLAAMNLKTFAIAETHKYGHVTYFWNGNRSGYIDDDLEEYHEVQSVGTDRIAGRPEMEAKEVTDIVLEKINDGNFDFIRINYANGDMVGHTGVLKAGIKAVQTVHEELKRVIDAVLDKKGIVLVTADHGNCEEMKTGKGKPVTSHSLNPVPCFIIDSDLDARPYIIGTSEIDTPGIANITATFLNLLGYEAPSLYEKSLLKFVGK